MDYRKETKTIYFVDDLSNVTYFNLNNDSTKSFNLMSLLKSSKKYVEETNSFPPFAMGYPYFVKGFGQYVAFTSDLGVFVAKFE